MRNNLLIPQTQINDKYNVIQTYTLLRPVIEEVMIQNVILHLLTHNVDGVIPFNYFSQQDINNEKFRGEFKGMILKYIRPFLKSLFPFDKYNPNSTSSVSQNTPLANTINYNYEQNFSQIMEYILNK